MERTSAAVLAIVFASLLPQTALAAGTPKFDEKVLYSFCSQSQCTDGKTPQYSGVIEVNGSLFGTTDAGGTAGYGTVFAIDLKTGAETVVHSFNSTDGRDPLSDLIDVNGMLYGTTEGGGGAGCDCGTVFSIDPNTGAHTVLHSFGKKGDGVSPYGRLVNVNGVLYGTTFNGGEHKVGTVFSFDLSTGTETVLHSFDFGTDGFNPMAGVVALKGKLYGTASYGGFFGAGAIFSVDLKTGTEKVVYSFCAQFGCPDGEYPETSLTAVNGVLYGMTTVGGTDCTDVRPNGCGVVFAFDPKTRAETVVHAFVSDVDGKYPLSGVVALHGALYGATSAGAAGYGAAFTIDLSSGTETILHKFGITSDDAQQPESGLTVVNGSLYGTALSGGANGFGAVFALKKKK